MINSELGKKLLPCMSNRLSSAIILQPMELQSSSVDGAVTGANTSHDIYTLLKSKGV